MKVLLLTETLHVGGAETFVVRLANALSANHDVMIAVMNGEIANPGLVSFIDPAVRLESLRLVGKRSIWRLDGITQRLGFPASLLRVLQARWLKKLVSDVKPDVIHSHLFKADYLAALVKRSAPHRFRHVITLHGDYAPLAEDRDNSRFVGFEQACTLIVNQASAIVGVAKKHVEWMTERYGLAVAGRLHLLYNGYTPFAWNYPAASRRDLGLPEGFIFGMVARGIESKGWRQAVDAFKALDRHEATLVLVGEGPFINEMVRAGLPERVIHIGFHSNPLVYIRHFNVGLLPTFFAGESLPTVVTEYLYCGVPVIASDVGEISSMLAVPGCGGTAGWLLSFAGLRISVSELCERMAHCLNDVESMRLKTTLTSAALTKFNMEACVAAYERLYEGLPDATSGEG